MININDEVSVIISVFNNSEYLVRSLNSVINQTMQPKEILVIDDGSSITHQKSIKKIINFSKTKIPIKYMYKSNGGPSSARNFGLKKSIYKYVCFLDVDDEMINNNIELKIELLKKLDSSKYFGVCSNAQFYNSKNLIFSSKSIPNIDTIGRNIGLCGSAPCYLFNKDILTKVNGFDENLINNEDFDLIIRLIKKKYMYKNLNVKGLIIHKTNNSVSRSYNFENKFLQSVKFLEKAKKNNYFSNKELKIRHKELYITYAIDMIKNKFFTKKIFKILKKSFTFNKPSNLKEYLLFLLVLFVR